MTFHESGLDDPSFSQQLPTGKAHPIHRWFFLVGCNSASSDGSGFSLTVFSATLSASPVPIPLILPPPMRASRAPSKSAVDYRVFLVTARRFRSGPDKSVINHNHNLY